MNTKLNQAVTEFLGKGPADMRAAFVDMVKTVHREKEAAAVENNIAMSQVFNDFGQGGGRFALAVKELRSGADGDKIRKFDQMTEFAVQRYRHLMPACAGESNTGADDEAFAAWVERGFLDVPKITDDAVMEEALQRLGPGFIEAYEAAPASRAPERERLTNTGVHYKIRGPVQKLAEKAWNAIDRDGTPPPPTMQAIRARLQKMDQRTQDVVKGLIKWEKLSQFQS
ncbi:MAG: hypothetical protein NXI32_04980 [bacterium]|nr:hypothetical protein [bacterium]